MHDVETLWAGFKNRIATAEDYYEFAARPRHERVFHGRARAGADRQSGDPAVGQCDGRNLSHRIRASRPRDDAFRYQRSLDQPISARADQPGRSRRQARDAARTGTPHRHVLPALCRARCHRYVSFGDVRYRRQDDGTNYHERFLEISEARAGCQCGDRRRDDRSQGRSLQGAASADPIRICFCMSSGATTTASMSRAPRCTRPARSIRTG